MKFLVGYKVDGGEFITIVEVSEDEANLREIERIQEDVNEIKRTLDRRR